MLLNYFKITIINVSSILINFQIIFHKLMKLMFFRKELFYFSDRFYRFIFNIIQFIDRYVLDIQQTVFAFFILQLLKSIIIYFTFHHILVLFILYELNLIWLEFSINFQREIKMIKYQKSIFYNRIKSYLFYSYLKIYLLAYHLLTLN